MPEPERFMLTNGHATRPKKARKKPTPDPVETKLPKLKKYEACAELVAIREWLTRQLEYSRNRLAEDVALGQPTAYGRTEVLKIERQLAAIEMAGAALTR